MDEKKWREKKAQNWLLESSDDDDDEFVLVKKISSEGGKKLNPNLNNGNYKTSSANLFNRASPNVLPSIYPSLKNFSGNYNVERKMEDLIISENWKGKSKNNSNQIHKANEKDDMKVIPPVYHHPSFHRYPINGYSLPLNLERMSQVQADMFPQKPSQPIFPSAPLNESSLAPPSYVSQQSSEGGGSIETSSINMDKIPWDEELENFHQKNKEDNGLTTKHLAPWKCSSPLSSSRRKTMKTMDEEKLTSKMQIFKCHLKMEFENGYRKGLKDANEMMILPGSSASSSSPSKKLVNPTTPTTTINNHEIGAKGENGLYACKKDKKANKYPTENDGSKKIRTTVLVKIIHESGKELKLKVLDKNDDEITSDDDDSSSTSSCYSSDRA